MNQLIAFRAIQGIGGGCIMAMSLTTIGDLFSPAERGKYQGIVAGVFGLSSIIGPTLGRIHHRQPVVELGLLRQPARGPAGGRALHSLLPQHPARGANPSTGLRRHGAARADRGAAAHWPVAGRHSVRVALAPDHRHPRLCRRHDPGLRGGGATGKRPHHAAEHLLEPHRERLAGPPSSSPDSACSGPSSSFPCSSRACSARQRRAAAHFSRR